MVTQNFKFQQLKKINSNKKNKLILKWKDRPKQTSHKEVLLYKYGHEQKLNIFRGTEG